MTDKEKLAYIAGALRGVAQEWILVPASVGKRLVELSDFALRQEK